MLCLLSIMPYVSILLPKNTAETEDLITVYLKHKFSQIGGFQDTM